MSPHRQIPRAGPRSPEPPDLYSTLVHEYMPSVYQYVYGAVADRTLAEDLTQDVFTRAWQHVGDLGVLDQARLWIFAVAANVVRDHYRRARLRRWLPLHVLDRHTAQTPPDEADAELGAFLSQVLLRLDQRDREMLLLVGLFEFSQREAARIVGISESAAQKRWQRSRDRFLDLARGTDLP